MFSWARRGPLAKIRANGSGKKVLAVMPEVAEEVGWGSMAYQRGARRRRDVFDPSRHGRPVHDGPRLVLKVGLRTRAEKIARRTNLRGGSKAPQADGAHCEGTKER